MSMSFQESPHSSAGEVVILDYQTVSNIMLVVRNIWKVQVSEHAFGEQVSFSGVSALTMRKIGLSPIVNRVP
jgi:hypothetical protein